MTLQKTQAIQTALSGDFETAIKLNQEILKVEPDDIETLNRLAFAYHTCGKIKEAKQAYQKVLSLDAQNLIASKNIKRLNLGDKKTVLAKNMHSFMKGASTMFLEETGRTKVVELINIAESKIVLSLMIGEPVVLRIKRLKIFVTDDRKQYIGMLPEDIGKRLIKFLEGGSSYETCVKSVGNRHISVFIREVKRAAKFKNQPTFISNEKSKNAVNFNQVSDDDGPEESR